ncbi:MAG: hypothetical protein IT377_12770 [Polyangiaceae bacterium]|nr:hypothetical protein [Polyangiaceae bacterium]
MRWLTEPLARSRRAVLETFAPAPGASGREIRRNGVVTTAVGMLGFVLGGAAMLAAHRWDAPEIVQKLSLAPILAAYVCTIVGGYRVLTGAEPGSREDSLGASLRRITIGIAAVVLAMGLLFGVVTLALYAFGA